MMFVMLPPAPKGRWPQSHTNNMVAARTGIRSNMLVVVRRQTADRSANGHRAFCAPSERTPCAVRTADGGNADWAKVEEAANASSEEMRKNPWEGVT